MDVEEEGSVKLSPSNADGTGVQEATVLLQPQVRVEITAHSLTDPDGSRTSRTDDDIDETAAEWQWYRTSSKTAMGTEIEDATNATYEPKDAADESDVGSYLRVVATYTDGRGPQQDRHGHVRLRDN